MIVSVDAEKSFSKVSPSLQDKEKGGTRSQPEENCVLFSMVKKVEKFVLPRSGAKLECSFLHSYLIQCSKSFARWVRQEKETKVARQGRKK